MASCCQCCSEPTLILWGWPFTADVHTYCCSNEYCGLMPWRYSNNLQDVSKCVCSTRCSSSLAWLDAKIRLITATQPSCRSCILTMTTTQLSTATQPSCWSCILTMAICCQCCSEPTHIFWGWPFTADVHAVSNEHRAFTHSATNVVHSCCGSTISY